MILLDSSVLIDYFNGRQSWQTDYLDSTLGKEIITLGDIIIAEVLQGFRSDRDFQTAKKILMEFPCDSLCNKELAIQSAENFRIVRKRGVTVRKTIDMIIATFCIENGFTLLHNDKDFDVLAKNLGLSVVEKPERAKR